MSNIIVQKYGGSSLSNLEEIKFVAKKIKSSLKDSNKIVIVVSAMGNTTDELVKLGESFLKNNNEIDNLRSKYEDENDAERLKLLEELNNFLMQIEKNLSDA